MYDPKVHVGVAALVVDKNHIGQVLLLKRAPDATHGGGTWAPPGGWVDYGETPEEAVIREVREEINGEVLGGECLLLDVVSNTYDELDMTVLCAVYAVSLTHPGMIDNLEPTKHTRLDWWDWVDVDGLELFPPFRSFVDRKRLEDLYL